MALLEPSSNASSVKGVPTWQGLTGVPCCLTLLFFFLMGIWSKWVLATMGQMEREVGHFHEALMLLTGQGRS